jgi:carboxyl-terminal processing protease
LRHIVRFLTPVACAVVLVLAFAGGYLLRTRVESALRPSAALRAQPAYDLREAVADDLALRYVRPLDRAELVHARTLGAMLAGLHDRYTTYLSSTRYAKILAETGGRFFGIGLRVVPGRHLLRVAGALRGSAAERAGIGAGDAIVAIDGVPLGSLDFNAALGRLRRASAGALSLEIMRRGRHNPLLVHLVSSDVAMPPLSVHDVGRGVHRVRVIRIWEFTTGVGARIRRLVAHAPAVVLDLRGNPGGLLDEAVATVDVFQRRGRIVSWSGAHLARHVISADGTARATMPLGVAVDGQTASAAEIVAASLHDHGRARLVGSRTFGKSTMQEIDPLANGGALKLTIATYRTPRGADLHDRGIVPDLRVRSALAVRRAVALVRR